MADLNKIVQRYEIQSDTSGLDQIATASDKAAASTDRLAATTSSLSKATDTASKSAIGVATALDRNSRAADPAQKALAAVERQQRLIDAATKQGQPIRQEWTNALAVLKSRHEELTKAAHENTSAVGLNRMQMFELGHVARSLADDMASGTFGVRSLAQEFGRVSQALSEGNGGVSGSLKAIGSTVGRLATGWLGFGVAAAAGVSLAATALARFQSQQDRLALSLNGAGRYAGVGLSDLTGIANQAGARNPELGQGRATSLAATLASTGRISGSVMPRILDLTASYARGTGQDVTKAGEELAKAFAEPSTAGEEWLKKLGALDGRTKDYIDSLGRQGDLLGQQQVLLTKGADAAAQMADRTWTIAKAWRDIESAVGDTFNKLGSGIEKVVNGPTIDDRYKQRKNELSYIAATNTGDNPYINAATEDVLQYRRGIIAPRQANIDAAANDKRTDDLSILIANSVKKAVPEIDRSQELTDTLKLLTDALNNPETLGKVTGGAGAVREALNRTQGQLDYANPVARARLEGTLSAQAAQADTATERTAIDARRAEIEVIAAGGSAALAAAKSLTVWNDQIARSNKEAEDALRTSGRNLDMSTMRPFERGRQEILNRYEDNRRNSVTAPLAALSPDDLRMTALDDRTTPLARAIALGSKPVNPALDVAAALDFPTEKLTNRVIPTMHARSLAAYRQMQPSTEPPSSPSDVIVNGAASTPAIAAYAPAAAKFAPGNITVSGPGRSIASTSSGSYARAQSNDLDAYYNTQTVAKLQQANDELTRNKAILDIRTASVGKSTDAIEKEIHVQELWNELQLSDNAKKLLGTERVKQLGDQIDTLATKQTAYDQKNVAYQKTSAAADYFQQTGNNIVGTLGTDAGDLFNANPRDLVGQLSIGDQAKYYSGQMSRSAVKTQVFKNQAGDFLRNLLFQQGINMVQKGLFGQGQYGSTGYQPGLLGGVFNSALGGLGGLIGGGAAGGATGAAGGAGNLFGSLFSGIGSLFGFADGGIMTSAGSIPLHRYATGGVANTPQLAMFGEGRKPEAYVPLADGRTIPVTMKGGVSGGGGAPPINYQAGDLHVHGSIDSASLPQVQAMIENSNKKTMDALQRNFGNMNAKWAQRVGS